MKNVNDISTTLMKVTVNISCWGGIVKSRTIQNETATRHGIAVDATRSKVVMLPKSVMGKLTKHITSIRSFVEDNTLPFQNGGVRIIKASNYLKFLTHLDKLVDDYKVYVYDEIYSKYDELKDMAKERLNGLYDDSRFPMKETICDKYGVSKDTEPLTDVNDIRINGLNELEIEKIKSDLSESYQDKMINGQKAILGKLGDVVQSIAEKLDKDGGTRYKGAIRNLMQLCDTVVRLNYLEISEIDELAKDIKDKFKDVTADRVKSSKTIKNNVKNDTTSVLNKLGSIKF